MAFGYHRFSRVHPHGSNLALLVTIFYTFLPCFFFVFIGAPWITKSGESQLVRSVLKLIPAAVVAAILQLTVFLVRGVLFPAAVRGARTSGPQSGLSVKRPFLIHLELSTNVSQSPSPFQALKGTVLSKQKSLHLAELRVFRIRTRERRHPARVSIADAPWRYIRPLLQLGSCPSIRLVGVTRSAGIWNAGSLGFNG